ncbi:ribonuclease HII [Candidatus Beckwithbacteria bacterium]|nr:ribonuclease HII [Candidatus Beckwithbacteria bacterium]
MKKEKVEFILGFDEVGRGCLAGPVVVACVLTPVKISIPAKIIIRDSKKMTLKQRTNSSLWIKQNFQFGIGKVEAFYIDQKGINSAVRKAASLALENLRRKIEILPSQIQILIDGRDSWIVDSQSVIKGDDKIKQISMASIIAKVYRDNLMTRLAPQYPQYGFENHVGYGTLKHRQAILKYGLISNFHRNSFCQKIFKNSF